MNYYIGLDIGGMSFKCGLVDESGKIIQSLSIPTKNLPQDSQIDRISILIDDVLLKANIDKNSLKGIGVGCPGAIYSKSGVVKTSANLKWKDFPLKELLAKKTGLPVRIANDADAATLGEVIFGAGKNMNNVILLTLGTGIGGGIVINGKLYEGDEGTAGELGHIVLRKNGILCGCGRYGCFEQYASATALIRQTKEAMIKNPNSKMWDFVGGDIEKVNGITSFAMAKNGDKTAKRVVDRFVSYLGEGILDYCNIFRPSLIILGGGISKEGSYLTDKLVKYLQKYHYGYKGTPIVPIKTAMLGNNAGIIGAASLIAEEF